MGQLVRLQTGPRSERGKRISSRNSLRHGLYASATVIRGLEDEGEYLSFARSVVAELGADSPLKLALAERVVSALWRARRPRRFEAERLSDFADRATTTSDAISHLEDELRDIKAQCSAIICINEPVDQVGKATVERARDGVSRALELMAQCYGTDPGPFATSAAIDNLVRKAGPHRTSRVRRAFDRARQLVADSFAQASLEEFLFRAVRTLLHFQGVVTKQIDDRKRQLADDQCRAMLLPNDDLARLSDAERRLEGHVSRALADFFATQRALAENSCTAPHGTVQPAIGG